VSLDRLSQNGYIRVIILLSFSLISVLFLVMADDVVLVMTSLIIFILSIISLLASLEIGGTRSREYVGKFGMRTVIPAVLVLFGFSILAGTGGIKKFSTYAGIDNTGDPIFTITAIIFAAAVYLYLFLYPFQGIYLKLNRRINASSAPVIWFLFVPAGIILLARFDLFFSTFYGRENIYGFIILAVLGFLNLLGAGIGAIKAASIKRLISIFILFQLGTGLVIRASGFIGPVPAFTPGIYNIAALIIILVTFLPLYILALVIEKNGSDDSISGAGALLRKHPYLGICFATLLVWWLAADFYIFFLQGPENGTSLSGLGFVGQGIGITILSSGYMAALLLMAANVVRIIVLFSNRRAEGDSPKLYYFPRVFYIYLSFFILLALTSVVLVIIGRAGIGQDHINIWGNTFNIFGNGN
jgi:hypothetical protein